MSRSAAIRLAITANTIREATEGRNSLIRQLSDEGMSLRVIADLARLSHTQVRNILVTSLGVPPDQNPYQ